MYRDAYVDEMEQRFADYLTRPIVILVFQL